MAGLLAPEELIAICNILYSSAIRGPIPFASCS